MWTLLQKCAIRLAAFVIACLGARWLYVFAFTDYRAHHRGIMIPLALVAILFAITLVRLNIWALLLLLVSASAVGAFAAWLQVSSGHLHPKLGACVVVSVTYVWLLGPGAVRALTNGSSRPPRKAAASA